MESIVERAAGLYRSESGRLALCAVCTGLLTACTIYGYQAGEQHRRSSSAHHRAVENAQRPHDSIQLNAVGGPATKDSSAPMSEELIREQLSRNYLFFGDESMEKIRSSFVVVVGVGGVGSWTATMLVRSGVQKIRIIDFDQVTLSSLNRHACATLADVGTSKVLTLQRYLEKVAPWVQVECRNDLFREEDADSLLEPWSGTQQKPDFVIDAIDNIETKADLLAYCVHHDLPVVASMGAALKSDPTRIYLSDISETFEDPLSRATRRHLKLRGIHSGIPVIYSTEKPGPGKAKLEPIEQSVYEAGEISELGILPDFRARILPVLGTMPPIFGLSLVTYVLTTMAGYPTPSTKVSKTRRSL
ncbi:MAG: tRNA threonylcarbamoyladenosine dehydratase, partial [Oxalobacteraceae bacterium]